MSRVAPSKVFAHLDRLATWNAKARGDIGYNSDPTPGPVTVEWDLSNRCSLGCIECHFAHTHVRGPWAGKALLPMAYESTGDLADLNVVARGLEQMAAAGVQGVVWSGGGEPTLHPGWTTAMRLAASVGLQQGMYTLGGHLTPATAATLGDLATWVVVSLDAADAESYAREKNVPADRFDDALAGIRLLAGRKADVGVSFLLHAANWTDADRMRGLARGLGATYVTFRPRIETDVRTPGTVAGPRSWVRDAMATLRWLAADPFVECDPERFWQYLHWERHPYETCYGVRLHATVTPDGRVWICPQRRGVTALGDLRTESFAEVWAKHPGRWTDFSGCRAMCRLHLVNEQLAAVYAPHRHEAFV